MFSYSRALVVGALLAGVASADSDNFIMSQVRTLEVGRVDPLVYPGANGPHIHTVVGGSKFDPDCTTTACLRQSKCSSSMVQADKSAYWSPTLFYKFPNGSMATMPTSTRIYYFFKGRNGTTSEMHAFPENFRMVAGPPSDQRPAVYPPRGELSYDQLQAMDPRRPYLPNDAPNGCGVVNAGIFYPSCNDGRLDSPDHFDHMRYPLDGSNGYNCPPSHPIKFPTMFMEHFYFPPADQPFHGEGTWILSSGDDTGLAYHADFINGWDAGVLESVVAQCNAPNAPADNLAACAPLGQSVSVDAADQCRSEGRIVYEEVGLVRPISQFPGCNNWPDNEQIKPACNAPQVEMGQPTGRYDYPDFKLSLPIANASAVNNAPQASISDTYTYSYSSTTVAATTSSASGTDGGAVKDLPTSSASTTTSTYDYNYGAPAAGTASSSATSTTTASYDYNYGAAPAATSSSSAVPTTTASDYNYGAPAPGTTSSTASPTTTVTHDYNYGAPAAGTSSSESTSSAVPTTTTSDYNYGAPPPPGADPMSTSTSSSVAHAAAAPATTSVSTSATATPSPQGAAVVGGSSYSHKPQKTCRPKHHGHKAHGQHNHRRNWQKRLIN
ncbi:hypothetical protein FRC10_004327 [Ceratobasidium sp. 414]|nr:hypothetical protein FRC10_004327 [Ceratobasidium sp. 414]